MLSVFVVATLRRLSEGATRRLQAQSPPRATEKLYYAATG